MDPSTVQGWKERGFIPVRQQDEILNKARANNIDLSAEDFFDITKSPISEPARAE
jgi:hypothetical protein